MKHLPKVFYSSDSKLFGGNMEKYLKEINFDRCFSLQN